MRLLDLGVISHDPDVLRKGDIFEPTALWDKHRGIAFLVLENLGVGYEIIGLPPEHSRRKEITGVPYFHLKVGSVPLDDLASHYGSVEDALPYLRTNLENIEQAKQVRLPDKSIHSYDFPLKTSFSQDGRVTYQGHTSLYGHYGEAVFYLEQDGEVTVDLHDFDVRAILEGCREFSICTSSGSPDLPYPDRQFPNVIHALTTSGFGTNEDDPRPIRRTIYLVNSETDQRKFPSVEAAAEKLYSSSRALHEIVNR